MKRFRSAFLLIVALVTRISIAQSLIGQAQVNWIPTPPDVIRASAKLREKFSDAPLIDKPVIVRSTPPVYPYEAFSRNISGYVRAMAVVNENGRVTKIGIFEVNPANVFDEATYNALKQWHFKVEEQNTKPIRYMVDYIFYFRIPK